MQDIKITVNIISLQEYLVEIDYANGQEVFEDFGVVAKYYAYATATGSDWFERCFVEVGGKDYKTAVQKATESILEMCAWHIK